MLKEEKVLGVKIHTGLNKGQVLNFVEEQLLKDGKCHYICTTNTEFVMDAQDDGVFRDIINNADLSLPDGIGLIFALEYTKRLQKYQKYKNSFLFFAIAFFVGLKVGLDGFLNKNSINRQVISGLSMADSICKLSADKGYTMFFLGGWPKNWAGQALATKEDLATLAANAIRKKYPNVHIIGSTSQFSREPQDDEATLAYIKNCMQQHDITHIDFLFVAYNHSHQERWIVRNAHKLPVLVSLGLGKVFDVFSNPSFEHKGIGIAEIGMQRNLLWLFNLLNQPWKYKRIFKVFPVFPLKVYFNSLKFYNRQK